MKRLLLFCAALLIGVAMFGQTAIRANASATQASTTLAATASYEYQITNYDVPYYIGYQVATDSVFGTEAGDGAVFTLYGSYDGTDYGAAIYTLTYAGIAGTSHDTIAVVSNTTASYYRFLKATWTVTDTIQIGHTIKIIDIQK